ncbi:DUF1318 domain-containing protein [bacterium]|nr:DUF1318 domain-containing protein [bacterium]
MNRKIFVVFVILQVVGYFGCTKHTVKLEQDAPFRVDVNMRIDVYQHINDHANTIEDIINSSSGSQLRRVVQTMFALLAEVTPSVYAQSDSIMNQLSPMAKNAIENRKGRRNEIVECQSRGVLGENAVGMVESVNLNSLSEDDRTTVSALESAENHDRSIIFSELAQIEGTSAEQVGKVYSVSLQKNAPAGTPIKVYNAQSNGYSWIKK